MSIEKKNKVIAEFIGRKGKHRKDLYTFKGLADFNDDPWYLIENAKFHLYWDWLMPVIIKIGEIELPDDKYESGERVYVESIYPRTFGMKSEEGEYMFRFNGFPLHKDKNLITAAYNAVIEVLEFI